MNEYPFCVFKRSNRPYYFVLFKDTTGNYISKPVSTKMKTEKEAKQVAFKWLRDGIPQKGNVVSVNELSLLEVARKIKSGNEAEAVLAEMTKRGWMKTYIVNETPAAENFISYLLGFWDYDTSPYINEKLRRAHGIHKRHCRLQSQAVTKYWKPFFEGRYLGEICNQDIDAFINYMAEQPLSASRKNTIIKAGFKALRWAYSKRKISLDPTTEHILFTGEKTKRNILNPTVAAALFKTHWTDGRAKLANMLASVTGMRSGEIIALRYKDIGPDCLYVECSWNMADRLKPTKTNQSRTVEIPFPYLIYSLLEQAKQNPWGVSPDSFVFWSEFKADRPMQPYMFVDGLREALVKIGYSKEEARKYLFHGWRHFFTSYMVRRLDKKLIKTQTGHRTDDMIELYSNHETEGDKELIHEQERAVFAGLIPERPSVFLPVKEPLLIAAGA
jgi:integrase